MSWFEKKVPTVVCPCECAPTPAPTVVQATNGWISVADQIPEYGVRVLVSDPKYGILTGHRTSQSDKGNYWELGCMDTGPYRMYPSLVGSSGVTHWRPMPPGPCV